MRDLCGFRVMWYLLYVYRWAKGSPVSKTDAWFLDAMLVLQPALSSEIRAGRFYLSHLD